MTLHLHLRHLVVLSVAWMTIGAAVMRHALATATKLGATSDWSDRELFDVFSLGVLVWPMVVWTLLQGRRRVRR